MRQTPSLPPRNIHLVCGGCPPGLQRREQISPRGAEEEEQTPAVAGKNLGVDGGKSFLVAKRAKMGKGLPGGCKTPLPQR